MVIWAKYWHTIAIQSPLLHEKAIFMSNPSNNLERKYLRLQNMWNLKIDLGTILWYILTLYPVTQNLVFWQLVPFNMLSHIFVAIPHNSTYIAWLLANVCCCQSYCENYSQSWMEGVLWNFAYLVEYNTKLTMFTVFVLFCFLRKFRSKFAESGATKMYVTHNI